MVGHRLRQAVEALGLRPSTVARSVGVSPQKLGNWMRGDHYPDEWFVFRFCNRYGVTADWLYRGVLPGAGRPAAGGSRVTAAAAPEAASAPVVPALGRTVV